MESMEARGSEDVDMRANSAQPSTAASRARSYSCSINLLDMVADGARSGGRKKHEAAESSRHHLYTHTRYRHTHDLLISIAL